MLALRAYNNMYQFKKDRRVQYFSEEGNTPKIMQRKGRLGEPDA